jgi:hypothetical protein
MSHVTRTNLKLGDNTSHRACLKAIMETSTVRPDAIQFIGRNDKLPSAAAADSDSHLNSQAYAVPRCMNEWRTRHAPYPAENLIKSDIWMIFAEQNVQQNAQQDELEAKGVSQLVREDGTPFTSRQEQAWQGEGRIHKL